MEYYSALIGLVLRNQCPVKDLHLNIKQAKQIPGTFRFGKVQLQRVYKEICFKPIQTLTFKITKLIIIIIVIISILLGM